MEIKKLQHLNLEKEDISSDEVEKILGGVLDTDGYEIPDISCTGGSGSCKDSCKDGCKDTSKEGNCQDSCKAGCSEGCKDSCKNGNK